MLMLSVDFSSQSNNKSYFEASGLTGGAEVTVRRGDLASGVGLLGPGSGGSKLCCPHCIIPGQIVEIVTLLNSDFELVHS